MGVQQVVDLNTPVLLLLAALLLFGGLANGNSGWKFLAAAWGANCAYLTLLERNPDPSLPDGLPALFEHLHFVLFVNSFVSAAFFAGALRMRQLKRTAAPIVWKTAVAWALSNGMALGIWQLHRVVPSEHLFPIAAAPQILFSAVSILMVALAFNTLDEARASLPLRLTLAYSLALYALIQLSYPAAAPAAIYPESNWRPFIQTMFWIALVAKAGHLVGIFAILYKQVHEDAQSRWARTYLEEINLIFGALSHEIEQPALAMRTVFQKLKKSVQNKEYSKVEPSIVQVEEHIGRLIRVATATGRITGEDVRNEFLNVNELCQDAVVSVKNELQDPPIRFALELSRVPALLGDGVRLEQAIINIVRNAAQAVLPLRSNGVVLVITRNLRRRAGQFIEVIVEDNGQGIPKNIQGKVMLPFYTTKKGGKGLGLFISRTFVLYSGGILELESPLDGDRSGTRIRIRLPVSAGRVTHLPPRTAEELETSGHNDGNSAQPTHS